jgi:hypothetical protein
MASLERVIYNVDKCILLLGILFISYEFFKGLIHMLVWRIMLIYSICSTFVSRIHTYFTFKNRFKELHQTL